VLDRIAPTALPRSSIIVSDEPLSAETNYRTEFVAVLSNQPQGGFITRERSVDVLMAGDDYYGGYGYGDPYAGNRRQRSNPYGSPYGNPYGRQVPRPFWQW